MNESVDTEKASTDHCPPHLMGPAMRLFGDMWVLMIVYNLLSGPRRFGELLNEMSNVSPKTISQRLKLLEEGGFVARHAFAEIPPRVEYTLTAKGVELGDVIAAIGKFAQRHLSEPLTESCKSTLQEDATAEGTMPAHS